MPVTSPMAVRTSSWSVSTADPHVCLRRVNEPLAGHAVDLASSSSPASGRPPIGIVHRDVKPDNVFLVPRNGATPS